MKSFTPLLVIFGAVIVVVSADPEKFKEAITKCAAETNVDQTEMGRFKGGDFEGASHNFMCFVDCFSKAMGFMDSNNVPQVDKMKEMFSKFPNYNEEKFNKAMDECKGEIKGADDCEKSFNYMVCKKKLMHE